MFVLLDACRARRPQHTVGMWLHILLSNETDAFPPTPQAEDHLKQCRLCQRVLHRTMVLLGTHTHLQDVGELYAMVRWMYITTLITPQCDRIAADMGRYLDVVSRRGEQYALRCFPALHFHIRYCQNCSDMVNLAVRGWQWGPQPHVPNQMERYGDLTAYWLLATLRASGRVSLALAASFVALGHALITARAASFVAGGRALITALVWITRDYLLPVRCVFHWVASVLFRAKTQVQERPVAYLLLVGSVTSFALAPLTSSAYLALAGIFLFFCGGMAYEK